jgi:HEAT repeat protein
MLTPQKGIAQVAVPPLQNTPVPVEAQAQNPATDPVTIARLVKQLSDPDETVLLKALDAVQKILDQYGRDAFQDTFLIPNLRMLLNDDLSWRVRIRTTDVLGRTEGLDVAIVLLKMLKALSETPVQNADFENISLFRQTAIEALARIGKVPEEDLIQTLSHALKNETRFYGAKGDRFFHVRFDSLREADINSILGEIAYPYDAAMMLGNKKASNEVWPLMTLLEESKDPKNREAAATALSQLGIPALIAIRALETAQRKGVPAAGPALAKLNDLLIQNLPSLIDSLVKSDNAQGFRFLVWIGRPVLPGLLVELAKPGLTEKKRAAISRIFRAIFDLPPYGLDPSGNPVQDAFYAVIAYSAAHPVVDSGELYRLNFKRILQSLKLPQDSKDGDIFKALLNRYGVTNNPKVARSLWPILLTVESRQGTSVLLYGESVVQNAIVALGITQEPASLALLKGLSNEPAYSAVKETIEQILSAAAESKTDIEFEAVISELTSMVLDRAGPYRRQALSALVAMETPGALAAVIGALGENDNPEVMGWLGELDPKAQAAAKAALEARNKLGVSEALTAQRTERPAWVYWLGGILALTSAFFIWVGNPHFPALRSGHRLFQRPSPRKQFPSIMTPDQILTAETGDARQHFRDWHFRDWHFRDWHFRDWSAADWSDSRFMAVKGQVHLFEPDAGVETANTIGIHELLEQLGRNYTFTVDQHVISIQAAMRELNKQTASLLRVWLGESPQSGYVSHLRKNVLAGILRGTVIVTRDGRFLKVQRLYNGQKTSESGSLLLSRPSRSEARHQALTARRFLPLTMAGASLAFLFPAQAQEVPATPHGAPIQAGVPLKSPSAIRALYEDLMQRLNSHDDEVLLVALKEMVDFRRKYYSGSGFDENFKLGDKTIADFLKHPDLKIRILALETGGLKIEPGAIYDAETIRTDLSNIFYHALTNSDPDIRLFAMEAIERIVQQLGKKAFPSRVDLMKLSYFLKDNSRPVRLKAIKILREVGDRHIMPNLVKAYIRAGSHFAEGALEKAEQAQEQLAILRALAHIGGLNDEFIIQALIQVIRDHKNWPESPSLRFSRTRAELGAGKEEKPFLNVPETFSLLIMMHEAANFLGELGGAESIPVLVHSLDGYPDLQKAAAYALGKIRVRHPETQSKETLDALLNAYQSGTGAAAYALARSGELKNILPLLMKKLGNRESDEWIVEIGRPVIPSLLTELAKPDLGLKERSALGRILRAMMDKAPSPLVSPMPPLTGQALVQEAISLVLGYSVATTEKAYTRDLEILKTRLQALKITGNSEVARALLPIIFTLESVNDHQNVFSFGDKAVRNAIAALGLTGDPVSLALLKSLLNDPAYSAVKETLEKTLSSAANSKIDIESEKAISGLVSMVFDKTEPYRRQALSALVAMKSPAALAAVIGALGENDNPEVMGWLGELDPKAQAAAKAALEARNMRGVSEVPTAQKTERPAWVNWLGGILALASAIFIWVNPHFPAYRSGHRLFQRPSPRKQIPSIRILLPTATPGEVASVKDAVAELDVDGTMIVWNLPIRIFSENGLKIYRTKTPEGSVVLFASGTANGQINLALAKDVRVVGVTEEVVTLDVDGVSREWDLASPENSDPITVDRSELRNSDSPIRRAANGTRRAQILLIAAMMGLSSLFLNSAEAPNSPAPVAATKVLPGQKAERPVKDQLKQLNNDFFQASRLSRAGDVAAGIKKELDTLESLRNMIKNHDLASINHPERAEGPLSELIEHCLILASDSTGVLKDATLVTLLEIIQDIGPTETFRPAYGSGESFLLSEFGHGILGSGPEIQRRAIKTIGELNNPYAMIVLESIYISQSAIIPKNDSAAEQRIEGMLQTLSAMVEINNTVRPKSEATERVSLLIPALRNITPKATRRTAILDEANAPDLSNRWRGLPHIVKLIKAPDAAELLRAIGLKEGRPAIPALIEALKAKDPELRDAAAATLETFLATMGEKDPDAPSVKMALKEYKMRPAAPSNFMPQQIKALIMPFLLGLVAFGAIIGGIAAWLSRRGRTTKQAVPSDNPSIDRSAHRAPKDTEGSGTKRSEIRLSDQQLTPPAPTKRNPSLEKTSIAAKLRTAILITFGIVSLYLPGRVYASIAPGLFPGHYPTTSVVSTELDQYPTYQKIITNPAAANTPRMVFDVRKDFPTLASVWPLIELARSQPGARIHLVIISDKAANPFADDLRKAGAGDVLDNNLFVRSYPSLSAVMIGFNRACDQMGSGDPAAVVFSGDLEGAMRFRLNQPPFPRPPVRPPALPTAFTQKANS